jgi:transcriptional regulator with XRE-family HTH domain
MLQIKSVQIQEVDLHKLCEKAGLSLNNLAERLEMDRSLLSRYANGHIVMSFPRWIQIKNILDKK